MNLFIVSTSTLQGGPYGPDVRMTFHLTEEEARTVYKECLQDIGEDHTTVVLVRVYGGVPVISSTLEIFQGNNDDFDNGIFIITEPPAGLPF